MKLILIGARSDGQAGVVIDTLADEGRHEVVGFLDNTPELQGREVFSHRVLGMPDDVDAALAAGAEGFHVAIGNGAARLQIADVMTRAGLEATTVIHPRAHIMRSARVGAGTFVGALAYVNSGAIVGEHVLLTPRAYVSHDVHVGDGVSISPGSHLGGRSRVGARTLIGLGASVMNDRSVGEDAVVGAGAVVTQDVASGTTVAGVPARPLDR